MATAVTTFSPVFDIVGGAARQLVGVASCSVFPAPLALGNCNGVCSASEPGVCLAASSGTRIRRRAEVYRGRTLWLKTASPSPVHLARTRSAIIVHVMVTLVLTLRLLGNCDTCCMAYNGPYLLQSYKQISLFSAICSHGVTSLSDWNACPHLFSLFPLATHTILVCTSCEK